jgi:DegV family protein with EDD domain
LQPKKIKYPRKHDIQTIPLFIRFDEEVFLDGVDMTPELLYQKVKDTGIMARSSGLRSTDFNVAFRKFLARGYDILYIGVSSSLSGSLQSAEIAKNSINPDRIFIVDSKNLSAGLTLLIFKAIELRNQGKSALEIKTTIESYVPKVKSFYIIPALDYLYAGGKMTSAQKFFGGIIGVKPIITVQDGVVSVYKKPLGRIEKQIKHLVSNIKTSQKPIDKDLMVITHSLAPKSIQFLKQHITSNMKITHLIESEMGCVISAHSGKETVGIAYLEE